VSNRKPNNLTTQLAGADVNDWTLKELCEDR
jgi:hypothetical protein